MLAADDQAHDVADGAFIETLGDDLLDRQVLLHPRLDNPVQHFVRGQRVLVGLAGAQLRRRRFVDRRLRDHLATGVEEARQIVDQRLGHVGDHGQPSRHVAVQGAVADCELGLVAGGEKQAAELVGHCHQHRCANAGLDVFFGDIFFDIAEHRCQLIEVGLEDFVDRDHQERDSEVVGQRLGVGDAAVRRVAGRHRDPEHLVGAESARSDGRGERRVDAAGQPQQHTVEAAFLHIIAETELERRQRLGRGGLGNLADVAERALDAPRITESLVGHLVDEQIFFEVVRSRHHPSPPIEDHGVTVKDQIIVAADLVGIDEKPPRVLGVAADQLASLPGLAEHEGARRQIDQ